MEGDAVGYEDLRYVAVKPFDLEMKCPDGMRDRTLVYDVKKREGWLKKAGIKWGEHFALVRLVGGTV